MAVPSPEHQPLTGSMTQGQPLRMSYEEYLAWADEDVHAEWVNGEVIVQMPPKEPHQRVVAFLMSLMTMFIGGFQLSSDRGILRPETTPRHRQFSWT